MKTLEHLFDQNRRWANDAVGQDPTFFEELAKQQKPKYLWIGCSDSRVPANQIVGLAPGEVFVHRNIANQVLHDDVNCMSVVEYAVDVLHVEHIIVCGHYGCGGVEAAMAENPLGIADEWIHHIREVQQEHQPALQQMGEEQARFDRLCELNVIRQVQRLCTSSILNNAWSRGEAMCVHGWIYHINNGLLGDLNLSIESPDEVSPIVAAAIAGSQ